jgi:hypothetical protein
MSVHTIVDILARSPNQSILLVDLLRQTAQEQLDKKQKKRLIKALRVKHNIAFKGLEEGDETKIEATFESVTLKAPTEQGLKEFLNERCDLLERVKSQYPEAERHLQLLHQERDILWLREEVKIPSLVGFDDALLRSILDYVSAHRGCSYLAIRQALKPKDVLQFDNHFDRLRNQRVLILIDNKKDSYGAVIRRSEVVAGLPIRHPGLSLAVQQLFRDYKAPISRQETFQQLAQYQLPLSPIEKDRLLQLATQKPKSSKRKATSKTKIESVRKLTNSHLVGQLDWLPDKKQKLV